MRVRFGIGVLVGLTIALARCGAARDPLGALARPTVDGEDPPPPYSGQQGDALEGGVLEGQRVALRFDSAVDVDHRMFDRVYLDKTELVAIRSGQTFRGHELEGVTFSGQGWDGRLYSLVVDAYFLHRDPVHHSGPDFADYRVTLVGTGDLCGGRRAMPIEGAWSREGEHQLTPPTPTFTFACADGVIFKCIDFGYRPWENISGTTIAGNVRTLMGFELHQACTRMARADYCADGVSHTMNDTWIHYYNIFDTFYGLDPNRTMPFLHQDPYHPNSARYNMYFEAAWRPGRRSGDPPYQAAALCLSKKRWSTIPLNGYCPDLLPDPRTPRGDAARFCDDDLPQGATERDLENTGALLFNDSAYVDLGLFRWGPDPSGAYYTTSDYVDFGIRPELTTLPPGEFSPPAFIEGAVFNHQTRWIPQGLIPLCSYTRTRETSNYLTTTAPSTDCDPPAPQWRRDSLVGLIYPPTYSIGVPLYLYADPAALGRYITTTQVLPPPYPAPTVIGKLPR